MHHLTILDYQVMNLKIQTGLIVLSMIFLHLNLFAQEYKTEKTKDGQITVKSRVSKRSDENGKAVQLIDYVATTAEVSLANCIAVLKDIPKHKVFLGEKESKVIKAIAENESIIYYYFSPPWPMPDFDCVNIMKFSEEEDKKSASFRITSAPTLFETTDVTRLSYYDATYAFKNLGNGKVEITLSLKMTPTVQAPDWLVRTYFPNGPADIVRGIVKLAMER